QPIDVLTAAKDRILRQRFSTSLITDIPDVRHHVIDGPHLLLQAQAPAAAAHIRSLCERAA
ncbi:MAG: hypothetical protein AAF270_13795, partial [Pseudomonadota bacterium]